MGIRLPIQLHWLEQGERVEWELSTSILYIIIIRAGRVVRLVRLIRIVKLYK